MLFMQQSKREICILSASGSISNASLRQPATSGGNITYEVEICECIPLNYVMSSNYRLTRERLQENIMSIPSDCLLSLFLLVLKIANLKLL